MPFIIDWEAGIAAVLGPWARENGLDLDDEALSEQEAQRLAVSVPNWPAFPDTSRALAEAHPQRAPQWRATPDRPGNFADPKLWVGGLKRPVPTHSHAPFRVASSWGLRRPT